MWPDLSVLTIVLSNYLVLDVKLLFTRSRKLLKNLNRIFVLIVSPFKIPNNTWSRYGNINCELRMRNTNREPGTGTQRYGLGLWVLSDATPQTSSVSPIPTCTSKDVSPSRRDRKPDTDFGWCHIPVGSSEDVCGTSSLRFWYSSWVTYFLFIECLSDFQ